MVFDVPFIPDPFVDVPPGFPRVVLLVMLLISTVSSGWVVFNTQRAMIWMASRGPEWWPGRATGIRLANKAGWVWFYRIDSSVVFVGTVLILITHLLKVFTR
jgi:hypothetical protein